MDKVDRDSPTPMGATRSFNVDVGSAHSDKVLELAGSVSCAKVTPQTSKTTRCSCRHDSQNFAREEF